MNHAATESTRLPVHLVKSRDAHNVECYFVIRASQASITRLIAKKNREHVDLSHFGEILASGFGTPTKSTCDTLKSTHGINLTGFDS